MPGPGPFFPVNGPRPSAPRYGLLKAATINPPQRGLVAAEDGTPTDSRVFNGVTVWPYPSDLPSGFDTCNTGSPSQSKTEGELPPTPEFSGLTVYEPVTCTARSLHDQQTFADRATVALEASEGWQLEHEVWTGEILGGTGTQPFLADSHADVLNGGVETNVTNGLALLEKAIAASGRQGWIIATWDVISLWSSFYGVYAEGANLRTVLGTIVVPFAGGDGSGPAGEATPTATQAWAYATGPFDVYRSEVVLVPGDISQAITMNPSDNTITYRAERYYVWDWDDTLHAAILIDRCLTDCAPTP